MEFNKLYPTADTSSSPKRTPDLDPFDIDFEPVMVPFSHELLDHLRGKWRGPVDLKAEFDGTDWRVMLRPISPEGRFWDKEASS